MADTAVALEDWLSITEAAELAGVGKTTLDHAEVHGEIEAAFTRLGRLFRRDDVLAWAAAREAR